jgi:hypothetical protein
MAKPIKNLTNMEIDEISLVDKGANQHAMITIAKRAPEEDDMPEIDLYAEDGSSINEDDLKHGDIVYDGEGNAYEYTENEVQDEAEVEEREPQLGQVCLLRAQEGRGRVHQAGSGRAVQGLQR